MRILDAVMVPAAEIESVVQKLIDRAKTVEERVFRNDGSRLHVEAP